jgi:hypothetical protein
VLIAIAWLIITTAQAMARVGKRDWTTKESNLFINHKEKTK